MDFLTEFPSLGKRDLRDLKKTIDGSFREWSRTYGDAIEAFFEILRICKKHYNKANRYKNKHYS